MSTLLIEALSTPSAATPEEAANILERKFKPAKDRSLIVLPEYFIHGENLYDGVSVGDDKVSALVNYAKAKRAHVFTGMVESTYSGNKYISGVLIGPSGAIWRRRKQTPTPFEMDAGIMPGREDIQPLKMEGGLGKLAIVMCVEAFTLKDQISALPKDVDVIVNPRGFDLDDPKLGTWSEKWLLRNRNIAMMGKCFVAGATGSMGAPGPMAEIIDFEGNILDSTLEPNEVVNYSVSLDKLAAYHDGSYQSATVPPF